MATKSQANQALLDKVQDLISTGDARNLVYLGEVLKSITDGTTIEEILTTQGDMIIMGAAGLEVITKDDLLSQVVSGGGGADFVKPSAMKPLFEKFNAYTMFIPAGFKVVVDGVENELLLDYELNLNLVGNGGLDVGGRIAGTDYYVYATKTKHFIVSANKTLPSGFSPTEVRLIGGFHYGLVPEDFTVRNNLSVDDVNSIKGIWARSAWDLQWMPSCGDTRGMTYNILGGWNDIYLCNDEHIVNGTSKAGAKIAGGATTTGRGIPKIPVAFGGDGTVTYGKMTWYNTAEIASAYKKRLLDQAEFQALAYGVKEASSAGALDSGIVKHIPDHVSPYMEQATGVQHVWSNMVFSDTVPTGYQADKTDGRGNVYSVGENPKAAPLGGNSAAATNSGSRYSRWHLSVWNSHWNIGGRLACDHLNLAPARTIESA